jgi:plastocyanin
MRLHRLHRPDRRSPLRVLAAALVATTAAACFSGEPPTAGPVAPQTATVEAGAAANTFSPSIVTVAKGGTVTWTIGARRHNVTFFANPNAPTNVESVTNTTATRTFTAAGTFPYNCSLHAGMTGSVIVQ